MMMMMMTTTDDEDNWWKQKWLMKTNMNDDLSKKKGNDRISVASKISRYAKPIPLNDWDREVVPAASSYLEVAKARSWQPGFIDFPPWISPSQQKKTNGWNLEPEFETSQIGKGETAANQLNHLEYIVYMYNYIYIYIIYISVLFFYNCGNLEKYWKHQKNEHKRRNTNYIMGLWKKKHILPKRKVTESFPSPVLYTIQYSLWNPTQPNPLTQLYTHLHLPELSHPSTGHHVESIQPSMEFL